MSIYVSRSWDVDITSGNPASIVTLAVACARAPRQPYRALPSLLPPAVVGPGIYFAPITVTLTPTGSARRFPARASRPRWVTPNLVIAPVIRRLGQAGW